MRLLQQTLRTSQCNRQPAAHPTDSPAPSDQEEVGKSETLLRERDGQVQSLCGHMERLTLEKDSLQQELKSLKIKVGEINDKLGMLMETIEAKDEVIMKLSQSSEQGACVNDPGSIVPKAQQEVDILKVRSGTSEPNVSTPKHFYAADLISFLLFQDSLHGYKSQNKFLNKEILELTELRRNAENREKALEAKVLFLVHSPTD